MISTSLPGTGQIQPDTTASIFPRSLVPPKPGTLHSIAPSLHLGATPRAPLPSQIGPLSRSVSGQSETVAWALSKRWCSGKLSTSTRVTRARTVSNLINDYPVLTTTPIHDMNKPGSSLSINTNPTSFKSRPSPVKAASGLRLYDLPNSLESPNPPRRARPGGLAALPSDPDTRSVYTSSDRHSQWTRPTGGLTSRSPPRDDGPTHEVSFANRPN